MNNQQAINEIWAMFRETDRKFLETDRKFLETDRKFLETDRLIKARSEETDRKIKEVTTSIGRLGNKLRRFVEALVRPAAVRLFRERGIDVHEVHRNVEAQRDGDAIEVDLLVVNNTDVVAIECKSTLSQDDVNHHLKRLTKLKKLLPSYADKRVMGAVTAMILPDNVAQYAYRQGLFVIAQTGDHLTIRNDAQFEPQVW